MRISVALSFAVAVLSGGCSDLRKEATAPITPAEAKELRLDAARLFKEFREKGGAEYIPLKPTVWPERFQKYKPLRVGIYRDGVALALEGSAPLEQGIHIVPFTLDFTPPPGRTTYERIQDGVYWYRMSQ